MSDLHFVNERYIVPQSLSSTIFDDFRMWKDNMVGFIGDDNVQRLSSTATTPPAVMSLVADAPKSIKTITIYSKYFAVTFDSIPNWCIPYLEDASNIPSF